MHLQEGVRRDRASLGRPQPRPAGHRSRVHRHPGRGHFRQQVRSRPLVPWGSREGVDTRALRWWIERDLALLVCEKPGLLLSVVFDSWENIEWSLAHVVGKIYKINRENELFLQLCMLTYE